ncbi:MAG: hypothetical protein HOJ35_01005, partial [Bdellovibrionales bacterium]|nr:hypothetical protein [Bdellovibrionales bacterium]
IENKNFNTGEKTLEELIPDNPQITRLIKKTKYYFRRFFSSREIRFNQSHNFELKINDIKLNTNFSTLGIMVNQSNSHYTKSLKVNFNIVLENFSIATNQIRVKDLMHDFLEEVGVNDTILELDQDETALEVNIPIEVFISESGKITYQITDLTNNIEETKLNLDFAYPMILPEMIVRVNGYKVTTRLDEVEKLLRNKRSELLEGLKVAVKDYLESNIPELLTKTAEKKSNDFFKDYSNISPMGTYRYADPLRYKLKPAYFRFYDNYLSLSLDSFINDPLYSNDMILSKHSNASNTASLSTLKKYDFDVAISIGQGMINKLITLSDRRGYYRTIESSDGTKYELAEKPKIKLKGRVIGSSLPPVVSLKVKYNVTGIKSYAVNNPITVSFDIAIKYKVKNGRAQILIDKVLHNSARVPRHFAKYEILWPKVQEAAKEEIRSMNKDLVNTVLSEDLPIPNDILGFPMQITEMTSGTSGNLIIFMNY